MRHITLAVQAAVISSVLSVASTASAETVDSLSKPPFFPAATEQAAKADSAPVTVMDSAVDLFEGSALVADPYANGIALQRAHVSPVYANSKPSPYGLHTAAVERGYMSAAAASTSVAPAATATLVTSAATPTVSAAIGMTVPLPASGLMLCLGLFGLARYARRSA